MFRTTVACCLMGATITALAQDNSVKLNQIQVIGTHNSYNLGFAPSEAKWLQAQNSKAYQALEYAHRSIALQLDGGVRQLEIDVFTDPKGGKYSHPRIMELTKQAGLPEDPYFDPKHEMDKPGIKTIHVQDLNQRSSCPLFKECLTQIRQWSKAHPQHLPIFVLVETKKGKSFIPGGVDAGQWTSEDFDVLDGEIRSVFPDHEMILPDEVRGTYPTLEKAVLSGNWPTLAKARGKVIFVMDQCAVSPVYTQGHPSLKGRVIFTNARPGEPDAAFVEMNTASKAEIDAMVKQGYLIRARTDEGTLAARNNDTTRRDEVLASGSQLISTDYPLSEPSSWSGYSVGFPGGLPARCDLVNAPAGCKDDLLEPGTKSAGEASAVHHPVKQ